MQTSSSIKKYIWQRRKAEIQKIELTRIEKITLMDKIRREEIRCKLDVISLTSRIAKYIGNTGRTCDENGRAWNAEKATELYFQRKTRKRTPTQKRNSSSGLVSRLLEEEEKIA